MRLEQSGERVTGKHVGDALRRWRLARESHGGRITVGLDPKRRRVRWRLRWQKFDVADRKCQVGGNEVDLRRGEGRRLRATEQYRRKIQLLNRQLAGRRREISQPALAGDLKAAVQLLPDALAGWRRRQMFDKQQGRACVDAPPQRARRRLAILKSNRHCQQIVGERFHGCHQGANR